MAHFKNISEEEKTEIYSSVSEMAKEGTPAKDIAEILEISTNDVRSICKDLNIKMKAFKTVSRALTKEELKFFKKALYRGETIKSLSQKMGIYVDHLRGLRDYLKLKKVCRDCHTILTDKYTFYCDPCLKQRHTDNMVGYTLKRLKNDPEFKAKWNKRCREYGRRKRLTKS